MSENTERIVIVDCCDVRFSKVISQWSSEPVDGESMCVSLFPGQKWEMYIDFIFLKKSSVNPFEFDAVFIKSDDETLFDCLCDCLDKECGWFEDEKACSGLSRIR